MSNVWVNGSDFKDDYDGFFMYHWRYATDHFKLDTNLFENEPTGLRKKGGTGFIEFSEVEWLDEQPEEPSTLMPPVFQDENEVEKEDTSIDAIAFAEWIGKQSMFNGLSPDNIRRWHKLVGNSKAVTTEELYNEYLKSKV